jgi:hypothetical protein
MSERIYSAYMGVTRGDREPISFQLVADKVTKREAHAAIRRALAGKHNPILLRDHTYFAIRPKAA